MYTQGVHLGEEERVSQTRKLAEPICPAIPDKLYFRIGEVARLLAVETHTLRFWESEFPQLKVGKGGTGQRLYRRRDVEVLFEIKDLLYRQGFTIPGARQILQKSRRTDASGLKTVGSDSRLERLRSGLRELSAMLDGDPGKRSLAKNSRSSVIAPSRSMRLATKQPRGDAAPGLFDPSER